MFVYVKTTNKSNFMKIGDGKVENSTFVGIKLPLEIILSVNNISKLKK